MQPLALEWWTRSSLLSLWVNSSALGYKIGWAAIWLWDTILSRGWGVAVLQGRPCTRYGKKIIPWAFLHLENQALKQGSLPNSSAECTMNESCIALLGEAQVAQCCPKTKSWLRDTFCGSDFPEEQAGAGVKPAARNLSYLFSFNFPPLSTQHLHDWYLKAIPRQ